MSTSIKMSCCHLSRLRVLLNMLRYSFSRYIICISCLSTVFSFLSIISIFPHYSTILFLLIIWFIASLLGVFLSTLRYYCILDIIHKSIDTFKMNKTNNTWISNIILFGYNTEQGKLFQLKQIHISWQFWIVLLISLPSSQITFL